MSYQGTPFQRFKQSNGREFHIKHIEKIVDDKCRRINAKGPMHRTFHDYVNFIINHFSEEEFNSTHFRLVEQYKQYGGRAFRKGRNPGSKNARRYKYPENDKPVDALVAALDDLSKSDVENAKPPQANDVQDLVPAGDYVTKREFGDFCAFDESRHSDIENRLDAQYDYLGQLKRQIDSIVDNRPTIVEIKKAELPAISIGIQHKNFPLLLKAANARLRSNSHLNVWLYGPAGTGKTTAAEKLAEAFDLKFYYNGALTSAFQLLGYNDANGKYVSTAFRKAWEHGGVYLFDEIDGSMPDALLAMNGALANAIASFPDGMIPRHPDCIIIAGANTTGMGGGIEYVGAMKQNAAFLNRFIYIPWPHDDALEDALCANKDWVNRVRTIRQRWMAQGNKGHLITMRATIFGEALLAAGLSQQEVEEATLKQGLSDAQWKAINH